MRFSITAIHIPHVVINYTPF